MPGYENHLDDYAECAVCRSDTRLLCSPCGDPVCGNCACPNGCDAIDAAEVDSASRRHPELAFHLSGKAA